MQHRRQPAQVAQRDRIIEPELRAQRGRDLGWDIRIAREFSKRVAGGERQNGKQHDADPK
jgi:hypothetical protein